MTGIRLWTLVRAPEIGPAGSMGDIARFKTDEFDEIIALFTEPKLALDLARVAGPAARMGAVNFNSPRHLRATLEMTKKMEVTHVGIDYFPPYGDQPARGEIIAIDRAIYIYGT